MSPTQPTNPCARSRPRRESAAIYCSGIERRIGCLCGGTPLPHATCGCAGELRRNNRCQISWLGRGTGVSSSRFGDVVALGRSVLLYGTRALDRLQQARTYEAVVLGHALPDVDASAAAGRGTGSDLTKGRADAGLRSADSGAGLQQINTIAGFDAVWELDIFGKFRREFEVSPECAPASPSSAAIVAVRVCTRSRMLVGI